MQEVHPLDWNARPSDFALTHCMKCEAGWTRRGKDGAKVIFCLLDREPVWSNMTDCDRFAMREA